jgi:hypothetical protein
MILLPMASHIVGITDVSHHAQPLPVWQYCSWLLSLTFSRDGNVAKFWAIRIGIVYWREGRQVLPNTCFSPQMSYSSHESIQATNG